MFTDFEKNSDRNSNMAQTSAPRPPSRCVNKENKNSDLRLSE